MTARKLGLWAMGYGLLAHGIWLPLSTVVFVGATSDTE
jgi:hypothetical protein